MGVSWSISEWNLTGWCGRMFSQKIWDRPGLKNSDRWGFFLINRTAVGGSRRNFGWKVWTAPGWDNQEEFWLGVLERPPTEGIRKILVGKCESEALGEMDKDVVRGFEGGCLSIKRTGSGLAILWNRCEVGSLDGWLCRGSKTKVERSYAP